jgi:predicted kinase
MGLPASGKSSFYHALFRDTHVRVNKDMLKTTRREALLVKLCIDTEMPFVVDKVNATRVSRASYISAAKLKGFRVIGYVLEADRATCLVRNAARKGTARVPDVAIRGFASRYDPPTLHEGFDELHRVSAQPDGTFDISTIL